MVQLGALAGQQVVVHDLTEQRVAEAVVAALVGDDDVRLGGLAQRRAQRPTGGVGGLDERVVGERASEREHAKHVLGRLVEALDAHHQRVAKARRHAALAVEPGCEQLLGEQRVALAAGEQAIDEVVLRRRAEDVLEQRRQLLACQRARFDAAGVDERSSSASSGRSGWRRCSSSER